MQIFLLNIVNLLRQVSPAYFVDDILFRSVVESMAFPLEQQYLQHSKFRARNIYNTVITPQVCYLEKALNDRYDNILRRIYITDGAYNDSLYLYIEEELFDLHLYTNEEEIDLYISTEAEEGLEDVTFIVNVPVSLTYNVDEFKAVVSAFKLAGRTFKIETI